MRVNRSVLARVTGIVLAVLGLPVLGVAAPSAAHAATVSVSGATRVGAASPGSPDRRGDAPPTAIPFGGQIRNPASNRCVDVQAFGSTPGTPVQLWDCNGLANQAWLYQNGQIRVYDGYNLCLSVLSDGIYVGIANCENNPAVERTKWTFLENGTIRSDVTGYCLAARSGGTANGTPLVVVSCDGAAREQWESAVPTPVEGGVPIVNPASNRCIDVPGIGTTLGTQVWLWDCKGLANQLWRFQGGQLRVYGNRDLCLDADGSGASPAGNGRKVGIWTCHDYAGEVWTLHSDGTIRSALDGRCLSVAADGTDNGSPLILWDCTGAPGQKWSTTAFPPTPIAGGGPVRNPASGRCLDVAGVGTAPGTQVWLWDCVGNAGQTWFYAAQAEALLVYGNYSRCLDADAGNRLRIEPCTGSPRVLFTAERGGVIRGDIVGVTSDDLCVTVQKGGTTNGTALVLTACNGSPAQKWDLGAQTPHFAPLAPAAPTAVPGSGSATVSWTAPADDGGSPITGYTVTASPGGQTVTVAGSVRTATVTGLTNGTSYTFRVTATNAVGDSAPSPASDPVTPQDGTTLEVTHLSSDATRVRVVVGHRAHLSGTLVTEGVTGLGGTIRFLQGDHEIAPDFVLTGGSLSPDWTATTKRFKNTGRRHVEVVYSGDDAHQGATTTITIRVVDNGS